MKSALLEAMEGDVTKKGRFQNLKCVCKERKVPPLATEATRPRDTFSFAGAKPFQNLQPHQTFESLIATHFQPRSTSRLEYRQTPHLHPATTAV
jgi:hypothetical protein